MPPTVTQSSFSAGQWFSDPPVAPRSRPELPAAATTGRPASTQASIAALYGSDDASPPKEQDRTPGAVPPLCSARAAFMPDMIWLAEVLPVVGNTRQSKTVAPGATPIVRPSAAVAQAMPCAPTSLVKSLYRMPPKRPENSAWLLSTPLSAMYTLTPVPSPIVAVGS